jgi:hypothetical protein
MLLNRCVDLRNPYMQRGRIAELIKMLALNGTLQDHPSCCTSRNRKGSGALNLGDADRVWHFSQLGRATLRLGRILS